MADATDHRSPTAGIPDRPPGRSRSAAERTARCLAARWRGADALFASIAPGWHPAPCLDRVLLY
jgi:hypothetical protein